MNLQFCTCLHLRGCLATDLWQTPPYPGIGPLIRTFEKCTHPLAGDLTEDASIRFPVRGCRMINTTSVSLPLERTRCKSARVRGHVPTNAVTSVFI